MNKLLLLAIVWLSAACIIEEPSPLGRPCDPKAVCGPGAVCRDRVCVSEDGDDAAVPDAEPDWTLPDIRSEDPVDASGDSKEDAKVDAPPDLLPDSDLSSDSDLSPDGA